MLRKNLPRVSSPVFLMNVDVDRAIVSHNTHSAATFAHGLGHEVPAAAVLCRCVDAVSGRVAGQQCMLDPHRARTSQLVFPSFRGQRAVFIPSRWYTVAKASVVTVTLMGSLPKSRTSYVPF